MSTAKKFSEFRQVVGNALRQCNAPSDLVDEVLDLDFEGEGAATALYYAYNSYVDDVKTLDSDGARESEYIDVLAQHAGNGAIEAAHEFMNMLNYGPGHSTQKFDPEALGPKVEAAVRAMFRTTRRR